ncbi:glutamate-1-semialdehyde 2,1-aminomutase [bacterium]|jgi:glutamate-1-semialdehyde 2,1-aminomutase|nr:glutamate-1-semialdehyde 2,1-aminomutase [bacterium]
MAKRTINSKLFDEAQKYLVNGVDSPVRAFHYVGCDPLIIKKGHGSKVYDHDGNAYIDYVLSWGSLILGHAFPGVVNAVKDAAHNGLSFGATNIKEVELAKLIRKAIPFAERLRFVNSGTEAVMGAVRLARGYTRRDKIIKFEGAYHGHADYLLTKSGSGLATLGISSSAGIPKDFIKHTIIVSLNDTEAVEHVFKKHGREIAAILAEPVGGNYGVLPPDIDFLKRLRQLTVKYKALLIFDEVITGFRFGFGSVAQRFCIIPDLIVLGKIIGGGLPIGAYGGNAAIMKHLAPSGNVYQASTFAGNPIVAASGFATLTALKEQKDDYTTLENITKQLVFDIWRMSVKYKIALIIDSYGSMFSLKFAKKNKFKLFYKTMLERGVYLAPSEFEANFLSFAHTKKDIEDTVRAADAAFRRVIK